MVRVARGGAPAEIAAILPARMAIERTASRFVAGARARPWGRTRAYGWEASGAASAKTASAGKMRGIGELYRDVPPRRPSPPRIVRSKPDTGRLYSGEHAVCSQAAGGTARRVRPTFVVLRRVRAASRE